MTDTNTLAARVEVAATSARTPCDFCKKPIVWAQPSTPGGKPMPVDADPSADGNVLLAECARGVQYVVLGTPAKRATYRDAGWPLRLHHRLSCPYAGDWNRPGGPKRGRQRPTGPARRGAGQAARR